MLRRKKRRKRGNVELGAHELGGGRWRGLLLWVREGADSEDGLARVHRKGQ